MANTVPIDFRADISDIKQKMGSMESFIKGAGKAAFGVWGSAQLISGVVNAWQAGITQIASFMKDSLNEAVEGVKIDAKLENALKKTGNAAGFSSEMLKQYADDLQAITTFSDETSKSVMTLLSTFTNVQGNQFLTATENALDMAEIFGSAESAAIQLGKALQDPVKGIQALSRVGVSFTDDQKAMIASLVELGDIAGAQDIILQSLADQGIGGMARASAEAAGGVEQLANQWSEVKEEAGRALLPILNEMLPGLKFVMEEIGTAIVDLVTHMTDLASEFATSESGATNMAETVVVLFSQIERAISLVWAKTVQWIEALKQVGRLAQYTPGGFIAGKLTGTGAMLQEDRQALNRADEEIARQGKTSAQEDADFRLRQFRERKTQEDADRAQRDRDRSLEAGFAEANRVKTPKKAAEEEDDGLLFGGIRDRSDVFDAIKRQQKEKETLTKEAASIEEKMADMRERIAEAEAPKGDGGFQAQFEDAGSMFRRIQSSVASRDDPQQKTAKNTDKMVAKLGELKTELQAVNTNLANVGRMTE